MEQSTSTATNEASFSQLVDRAQQDASRIGRYNFRLAVVAGLGILTIGTLVGQLPNIYTASVSLRRTPRPGVAQQRRVIDASLLRDEILSPKSCLAVLQEFPQIGREFDANHLSESFRAKARVKIETESASSDLIHLELSSIHPDSAARVVDRLSSRYVEELEATYAAMMPKPANQPSLQPTSRRLSEEKDRLARLLAERSALRERQQGTPQNLESVQLAISTMVQQRDKIRQSLGSRISAPGPVPLIPESSLAARNNPSLVEQALEKTKQERDQLASTFTDQHPAVVALDRKIRELSERASLGVHTVGKPTGNDQSAAQQLQSIENELATIRQREKTMLIEESRLTSIDQEVETVKSTIAGLENEITQPVAAAPATMPDGDHIPPVCRRVDNSVGVMRTGPERGKLFALGSAIWLVCVSLLGWLWMPRSR